MIRKYQKTIDILGTEYKVMFLGESDDSKLYEKDGYVDTSTKEIVVRDDFIETTDSLRDLQSYQEKVLRHEIIHAFLHESGLSANCDWATEECVDWFAIQYGKIVNAIDSVIEGEVE